jgi:hypothetical protein
LIFVLRMVAVWAVLPRPMCLGLDIQGGSRMVLRARAERQFGQVSGLTQRTSTSAMGSTASKAPMRKS